MLKHADKNNTCPALLEALTSLAQAGLAADKCLPVERSDCLRGTLQHMQMLKLTMHD